MHRASASPRGAVVLTLVALTACGRSPAPETDVARAPTVYTTFYPTTYFAHRVAQGVVPVVCPLPENEDPITWQPGRDAISEYQAASVIIVNGASFEKWVALTSLPESRIVDTAAGLANEDLVHYDTLSHSHGPAGDHTHEGLDGHLWLDPTLAQHQAAAIEAGLTRAFPEHAATFRAGREALDADLATLDDRLRGLTPRLQRVRVLCSHPAYNYLDRRYGWNVRSLDLDPAVPLTTAGRSAIEPLLPTDGDDTPVLMLWESAPTPGTVAALRDRYGITSVVFSPAETLSAGDRAAGADYLSIMNANLDRLETALPPSR